MILALLDLLLVIGVWCTIYALKRHQLTLGNRIMISMVLGICYGLLLKLHIANSLLLFIKNILFFVGNGYLALLKMLVIPLILTSIIHAILNLGFEQEDGIKKISLFTCVILLMMTAVASLVGILIGKAFHVGYGLILPPNNILPDHSYSGLANTLLGMLPSNPVAVMTQGNTIAVVLFALFLGIAARMLDEKDNDKMDTFKKWIASLFAIVKKLAVFVLGFTPYGIFSLLALMVQEQGLISLDGMLTFIMAMYSAMILVVIMHCIVLLIFKQNPLAYLKKAYTPLFVAFTTRSSFGTLPVTEETLREQFATKQVIATFVPSIGATIGMNACAGVFPAMLVVMTLTILHQPLTPYLIVMVMFINAIASLGISGIPGTAFIAATVTLTSLNLPYAIVGLVQGIDPIVDMGRTATNVSGTMTTALVVDKIVKSS